MELIRKIKMEPGDVLKVFYEGQVRRFVVPGLKAIEFYFDPYSPWESVKHLEEISQTNPDPILPAVHEVARHQATPHQAERL